MKSIMAALLLMGTCLNAAAQPGFSGTDYSGVYDCTGDDAHAGKYTGTVTLKLIPAHSRGTYASYDFKLEVPGFGTYLGHAAGHGDQLAMHFALTDQATRDYGTGIAVMRTDGQGQTGFHKFYYQPEYEGGNTGLEDCMRR